MKKLLKWLCVLLLVLPISVFSKDINGDKVNHSPIKEIHPEIIKALLHSGGTYVILKDANSMEAWADLMSYLGMQDPEKRYEVPLPLGVKYFGLAEENKDTTAFLITPAVDGVLSVSVDSKGSFAPQLKVNDIGKQTISGNIYRINFDVKSGKTYRITLNKLAEASGLYSIEATITAK